MDIEKKIKKEIKKLKYTNYIINGDFIHIEDVISKEKYYKEVTIIVMIPVAIAGLAFFTSVLPFAATIDTSRILRYHLTKYRHRK